MSSLSPQYEAFIRDQLASGVYPTREKVIEAGLEALREAKNPPLVPDEHMELVEEALEEIARSGSVEMTADDWRQLHQLVDDVAAGRDKADG